MEKENRSPDSCRRAVFLDRDGVLNRSEIKNGRPYAPRTLSDFHIERDAAFGVRQLRNLGFLTIVVTNQKDVGAGLLDMTVLNAMHEVLQQHMTLDAIKVCTCIDECPCYKPNPGMLQEAAHEFEINLSDSYMIGDRWRDIDAGKRAGCTTIFIDYEYKETLRDRPDYIVTNFLDAVDIIASIEGN